MEENEALEDFCWITFCKRRRYLKASGDGAWPVKVTGSPRLSCFLDLDSPAEIDAGLVLPLERAVDPPRPWPRYESVTCPRNGAVALSSKASSTRTSRSPRPSSTWVRLRPTSSAAICDPVRTLG